MVDESPACKRMRIAEQLYVERELVKHVAALSNGCASGKASDKTKALRAAEALMQLSSEPEQRQHIVAAGAVQPLILLLRCGGTRGRVLAAGVLDRLGSAVVWKQDRTRACDVIQLLVSLLRGKEIEGKANAAGALFHLSSVPDFRTLLVQAGTIHFLLVLLRGEDAQGQVNAAKVLANLAASPSFCSSIVAAGSVPALVALLTNGSLQGKTRAALALHNLAADTLERKQTLVSDGAIPPLLELLRSADPRSQVAAAATLQQLARAPELHGPLLEAGAAPSLAALLNTDETLPEGRLAAVGVLKCLVQSGEGVASVGKSIGHLSDSLDATAIVAKLDELKALETGNTLLIAR